MLLGIVKIFILLTVLFFFGWQFLRRILKQNELYFLVPFSLALGISAYVLVLNSFGYILGITKLFYIAPIILVVIGILLFFIKVQPVILGISRKTIRNLVMILLFFVILFAPIYFTHTVYDEAWHGPMIGTISEGNFPVMSFYLPDYYGQYHYAFDLFAAAIKNITGAPTTVSSDLVMIIILTLIFPLAFGLVYKISKNKSAAYLSAWLLFFGGGLRWLAMLKEIRWGEVHYLWDFFRQITDILFSINLLGTGYLHPYSVDSLGGGMYHRPMFFSIPIILIIFWLIYLENKRQKFSVSILLGLMLGYLALTAETSFGLIAISYGLWKLIAVFKDKDNRKKLIYSLVTVTLISSFVAIFQGGIITDSLLHSGPVESTNIISEYSSFAFRKIPGLTSYDAFFPITKAYTYLFWIMEWGIPLILLPFIYFYFLKRKKNPIVSLFLLIVVLGLFLQGFVSYPLSPGEMVRINNIVYYVMGLLAGMYLAEIYSLGKLSKKWLAVLLILAGISPFLFNFRAWPTKFNLRPLYIENGVDFEEEEKFADLIKDKISRDEVILTITPKIVTQLWGNRTYYGSISNRHNDPISDMKWLFNDNDIEKVKARGVNYMYVNPLFLENGGNFYLMDHQKRLQPIYDYSDKYRLFKIN